MTCVGRRGSYSFNMMNNYVAYETLLNNRFSSGYRNDKLQQK